MTLPRSIGLTLIMMSTTLSLSSAASAAEERRYEPNWASLDQRPMPDWYADAKFGIFIHWGVYSVPAWGKLGEYAEWYWHFTESTKPEDAVWRDYHRKTFGENFAYADFAPQFKAELFDAEKWADLFVKSGAKYIVPTSKHHEGFALWPSAEASRTWGRPWNAAEVGPHRDLLKEIAEATRERGLKFGVYFSLYEWYNPLWKTDRARYVTEHMTPQFKDVVTRFHPSLIFADGEWEMASSDWHSEELLAWLFNESASRDDVVINDRWGSETRHKHGGYWTTEYTPGLKDDSHAWEESRGMAFSYGLNRVERVTDYKSSRELILTLADLVSRGGNLLLDIGPAADGTIPPLMEERLLDIGDWLRVNGEAIYGTRFAGRSCQWSEGVRPKITEGEYRVKYNLLDEVGQTPKGGRAVKQVFFTKKPDALFAITAGWPGGELELRNIRTSKNPNVILLGRNEKLLAQKRGDTLTITLPKIGPEEAPCRDAYVFKIAGAELLPETH